MQNSETTTQTALRRDIPTPLYVQLEEILRAKIDSGEWQPGDRIPSENELNRMYGISRMTARGVLNTLTNDGLVFRVPGKGTFVSSPKIETASPAYSGIREQLEGMGLETETKLLSASKIKAPTKIAKHLHISTDDDVYEIRRVRYVKGSPISLHTSWVPAELAPDLIQHDTVNRQLCKVLGEEYDLQMSLTEEQLESTVLSGEEADLLELAEGRPVLLLQDILYDQNEHPFEFTKIIFPGDKIRLRFTFKATEDSPHVLKNGKQ